MAAKKIVNFCIVSFIIAGIILFFGRTDWFPEFYKPVFMSGVSFASAALLMLPRFIFRPDNIEKRKQLENLRLAMAISLAMNGLGGLGLFQLYKYGFEFDKLTHFFVSLILAAALAKFLGTWFGFSLNKSLTITIALVAASGLFWEFLEVASDALFKTQTLGIYGKEISKDTLLDIACNVAGIIFAALMIFTKRKKG